MSSLKGTYLYLLQDACHTENGGWGHFTLIVTDRLQQIISCVIQSRGDITKPFSVGSPQYNHLILTANIFFMLQHN